MKKRYYLRGLGAGIMLSAIVSAVSVSQNNNLSDEEIRTRAQQLGMVEEKKDTKETEIKSKKEAKNSKTEKTEKNEKTKETKEPTATLDTSVTSTPDTQKFVDTGKSVSSYATEKPKQEEVTKQPVATKNPVTTKKPQMTQKKYISVTIEAGMWSDEISKKFKDLGLVDDAETFDDFLCDNGYASMIKVGVYEVPTNATYTEIANIITK